MDEAGFEEAKVEENSSFFVSFLSKVLIIEAEKLITLKLIASKIYHNGKKRTIDECLEKESPTLCL